MIRFEEFISYRYRVKSRYCECNVRDISEDNMYFFTCIYYFKTMNFCVKYPLEVPCILHILLLNFYNYSLEYEKKTAVTYGTSEISIFTSRVSKIKKFLNLGKQWKFFYYSIKVYNCGNAKNHYPRYLATVLIYLQPKNCCNVRDSTNVTYGTFKFTLVSQVSSDRKRLLQGSGGNWSSETIPDCIIVSFSGIVGQTYRFEIVKILN